MERTLLFCQSSLGQACSFFRQLTWFAIIGLLLYVANSHKEDILALPRAGSYCFEEIYFLLLQLFLSGTCRLFLFSSAYYTAWSMNISNTIRTGRHCVFNMHAHLVFVTKYRRHVFTKKSLKVLAIIFEKVCHKFESSLIEFEGEKDHVHLLIHYPPKLPLSKLVNSLKGVSSRLLRKHIKEIRRYYWKNVLWSPSYFASSCGGAPIAIIKEYIQGQKSPS